MSDDDTNAEGGDSGINITLGKLIAYPIGVLLILGGLGSMVENAVAGILILLSGIIALPIVRSNLKQSQGVAINRWATVGIVLVLVVAGGALVGGQGGNGGGNGVAEVGGQGGNGGGNGVAENGQSDEVTHQMGESFTVGEDSQAIEYTVQDAYTTSTIFGFEAEETDEQFVIVELGMENVGEDTVDISTRHLKVVDSQDRQFDVDNDATFALDQDGRIQSDSITFEQLQPGVSTQGAVAFELPADETELRFKIEPVGIFSTADEHFVELEIEDLEE